MQDVIVPFFVLMSLNTLILALWTAIDPLTYQRKELEGTDGWNRPIASIGVCQSENHGIAFLIPMAIINASVLLLANWQAYQARMIQSEFSESKYIVSVISWLNMQWNGE